MELLDVTQRLAEPELLEALAPSVGNPTPDKLATLAATYARDPLWSAFALFDGTGVVGIIGLESTSADSARIRHVSVAPRARRSGVGRRLLDAVRERMALAELYAETHAGAVPFYERCGFTVRSLGELYPGVERFSCWWSRAA